MRVNVSADSSNVIIDGLNENVIYFVQVSASTSIGGGVVSSPHVTLLSEGSSGVVVGVAGGVVVAVVIIIAVTVIVLAVLTMKMRNKQNRVK